MRGSPVGPPVFRLRVEDADRFVRFRRRMLQEAPWAFSASLDDDTALDPAALRDYLSRDDRAIFAIPSAGEPGAGAPAAAELLAAVGLIRAEPEKYDHRSRIWGLYVDPDHRGRGFARAVLTAALDLARSWPGVDYVDLGVSENAPDALHLYRSLGFQVWGREPGSTQHGSTRFDEIFLTLDLRATRAGD
jgi:ribosomal protein S18 acetylase RimI-like enzyme